MMDPLRLAEKDTEQFTKRDCLLQEFHSGKDCFSSNDLKELIQTVLHQKDFDAANADHDIHNRPKEAVDNHEW
jgi:hypothetical protein